jgi:hypothetical protein
VGAVLRVWVGILCLLTLCLVCAVFRFVVSVVGDPLLPAAHCPSVFLCVAVLCLLAGMLVLLPVFLKGVLETPFGLLLDLCVIVEQNYPPILSEHVFLELQ